MIFIHSSNKNGIDKIGLLIRDEKILTEFKNLYWKHLTDKEKDQWNSFYYQITKSHKAISNKQTEILKLLVIKSKYRIAQGWRAA